MSERISRKMEGVMRH